MQRIPTPLCHPVSSNIQISNTMQELQYGSQTNEEKSHSNSQTNQSEPTKEVDGLVVFTGSKEKKSVTLEYRQETGANKEHDGKEHTDGNFISQPQSKICFTASFPSVPQSSVESKVQDTTEIRAMEQTDHKQPGSQTPSSNPAEQEGGRQNSNSPLLTLPLFNKNEREQTDLSKSQAKIVREITVDARELQNTNSVESLEIFENVEKAVDTSHKETPPPTAEVLKTSKTREMLSGLCSSPVNTSSLSSTTCDRGDVNVQMICHRNEGVQVESNVSHGHLINQLHSAATMQPECSSIQETLSKASPSPLMVETGLVVSLQTDQVVEAGTSCSSDQIPTTETPLIAQLVHSTDAQEIVVVREEGPVSGHWSEMHLNPSYLLQQEDGSVCEAAIVNELSTELSTGQAKLYGESVQTDIDLESQAVEVYEFCGLVEEVAEETVCASSSSQIPHSPGYEVNLFNALLDNTDDYTVKEDLDSHLETSIHTVNENDSVIISQQPIPSSLDTNQIQTCSKNNSHTLSLQNTSVATVGQHLILDATQAVEVANSSEVCLVEVAALTSNSFTVEQADISAQTVTPRSQASAAVTDLTDVSVSPVNQIDPLNQEAEVTSLSLISPVQVVTGENTGMDSSIAVSLHDLVVENQPSPKQSSGVTVVSATKPEDCVSSHEETKETASTEAPLQNIQNVVTTETPLDTFCSPPPAGKIDPKLLLLKPGVTPVLKHPPSLLAQMSKEQNAAGNLANAHSSWPGTVSEECLSQTVSTADSRCTAMTQTQCSVSKTSLTAPNIQIHQPAMSSEVTIQIHETASVTPATSKSESDTVALAVSETIPQSQIVDNTDASPPSKPHSANVVLAPLERESTAIVSMTSNDSLNQPDSFLVEEESEDMEQDETLGETEPQEATPGQVSSAEEGSDEDPETEKTECDLASPSSPHKHGQSRTDKKALFHKVRQWIADRVAVNSSPVSPSTSSSYPGQSSTGDWSTPRREKASPLRGPHGKFVSPSSVGYSSSSSPPDQSTPQRSRGERHTDMAELAKHEADIEHRTQALKREGFWSMKRLTRLTEPPRPKVHWDYLCEEMQWLSADFAQERRWKRGVARKVVRMVMRHHEELRQKEEKAKRDEHAKIRRVASSIAKEVRAFWSSVEKVVQYKQQSRLEEKRKKALDLQLDFIVGQTEKYSDLLSQSLAPTRPTETVPVTPQKSQATVDEDDRDFEPPCEEEDDEETIEVEEQQEGNDAESHRREIELLKEESMLPLDQLLSTLNLPQDSGSEEECSDESSSSAEEEEEDREFTANEEDAEDEEDTIAAQEKVEGNVDHAEELDDLAKEGDMSIEELLEKYKGAYNSDFEAPSVSGSKASSDEEVSGDEEEETEEDESDAESNTSSSDSPGDSDEEDSDKDEQSEEGDDDDCGDEGMEILLKEGDHSPTSSGSRPKKEISHIAATAESLQPKGYTLATTKVKTPIPFLLHGTLREYQHIGLDWLVTMYEKKLNGILADEMGLGKTIQTIALLAHLACEKGNWGPHLIIVPTSVMLNWEMELKRWCPGFKILTYFGSQKERKLKRQGWTKPNAFHVCITSYKLVLQDHQAFRRKSWRYLILDEAQNIKNFKSQRWQSLLNFNSHRRLLLTGTPLQNSLMELWSLMHFLMPHVFQSHREFKEWFSNPLTGMIEGSQEYNEGLVKRLHKVLRPFLLRRIKADVEKQMPKKYEHVVRCRLSKRQRFLYDDFMAQASTRETLASGHFMSVINILMQLRKVCNHPNLFDPRPIQSPFITQPIVFQTASLVNDALEVSPLKRCDLSIFDLVGLEGRVSRYQADIFLPHHKVSRQLIQEIVDSPEPPPRPKPVRMKVNRMFQPPPKGDNRPVLLMNKPTCPVSPATQTPKPPPVTEVTSTPSSAPVVQQVVCSVAPTPPPRPSMHPTAQTAVRSSTPKPMLTVRPPSAPCTPGIPAHPSPNPSNVMPQRVLLSPDMQARLPSGEVVSIAQLASLAGRPVSSCQGSKPVTFQLQGNKLTLSGAQIHQVPAASPRQVQGNVMHLVSSGVQHHLISQPAQVTVQTTANTHPVNTTSPTPSTNRLPQNASSQVPPSMVSSSGVVKIVVRQSAASVQTTVTSSASKSSAAPRDNSSSQTALPPKARPSTGAKVYPLSRKVPRPPPRSPFYMSWLAESQRQQQDSKLDFILQVNERHCGAKPVYGLEVLNFLTFLHGPHLSPAPLNLLSQGEWGRSGHSSCLFAQTQNKNDYWFQSHSVRDVIHSIEERLELLTDIIDRFTFVIPPVEAPQISMHCCHPPPSQSHKQTVFSSMLSTQIAPLTRSLHRVQCNMRTQFPDLRLIQYDCGKLQTLHTLLRKLKTGGHRVLIFTQMTRMLDVLEQFLNYHGHIYLRLDGSTRVEQRQALMERFNADRRIFCFILSTRSGGVGVNLTGADTVVFYDSDWNPTMDAQAQDRCHRIGQTRDVHIYRLISERTVEENILKKANQKRMLGDMAIEGGNFTTAFFKQQTIRELFDVNDGEKREMAVELSVPQADEEEAVNKQSTTILEQALCRAEDEEDIVAASQAKAEQVAELAEFNENIPLDDGGDQEEVEELSKAEQEIAALVEQLTPIERYAMNFLEASLEDVCKEELKQAEEQVEAARKGLDQAKEEGLKLHASSDEDEDDFLSPPASVEPAQPTPARRGRRPKDRDKEKTVTSTRMSGRLRGASPDTEPEPTTPREVPERHRFGLRGRGAAKDTGTGPATPLRTEHHRSSSTRLQESSKSSKASSPARDHQTVKTRSLPNRSHPSPVPSPTTSSPPGNKQHSAGEIDSKISKAGKEAGDETERQMSESLLESGCPVEQQAKDNEGKEQNTMSPPSISSRSPRKRQSADVEVLKGLVEDSPSAKVLRKLPGRLVTVVEEKEPRKRKRRGSGTGGGGSSEEATLEEHAATPDEPSKDNISPSPDSKTKETVAKTPQDQDSTPAVCPTHLQPVRSYPPYSPPHLSPDMPVLRNLPVRRRVETESRMAAQLGEQLHRGRGGSHAKKTDCKETASSSTDSNVNSLSTPLKRRRGRPPKTPPRITDTDQTASPSPQPTSPSEEGNPPLSPKRKRGRPLKDSTSLPDTDSAEQISITETTSIDVSDTNLNTEASTEQMDTSPNEPENPVAVSTSQAQSTKAEDSDTKSEVSASNPIQAFATKTDQIDTPVQASSQSPTAPSLQMTTHVPDTMSTLVSAEAVTSPLAVTGLGTTSAQVSPLPSLTVSTPATISGTGTITTISVSATDSAGIAISVTSKASDEPKVASCAAAYTAGPEPATTTTAVPSVATTIPTKPYTLLTLDSAGAVPPTGPITIITTATTMISEAESLTPAIRTTVKSMSTGKTFPVKDLQQTIARPSTTSVLNTVTFMSPTTQTFTSITTSSPKSVSQPPPTAATSVKPVQMNPSFPNVTNTSAVSTPVTAVTAPVVNTIQTSQTRTAAKVTKQVTSPQMSKSVEHIQAANVREADFSRVTLPPSGSICTTSPATVSESVTTTSEAKTVQTEGVKCIPLALEMAHSGGCSKQTTPVSPVAAVEKTDIIAPVKTSVGGIPAPLTTVISVTSSSTKPHATNVTTTLLSPTASLLSTTASGNAKTVTLVATTQSSPLISSSVQESPSTVVSSDVSTLQKTENLPRVPTTAPSVALSTKPSLEKQSQEGTSTTDDSDKGTKMEVDTLELDIKSSKGVDGKRQDISESQPKRRTESSSVTKDTEPGKEGTIKTTIPQKVEPKQQMVEEGIADEKSILQKRPLSRQSSQESTRSSSPSSGCSTSTLTRHAHHKKTYENRHAAKRRRVDMTSEAAKEEKNEEDKEKDENREDSVKEHKTTSQRRRSRSSSSSSDSDSSESRKEHRLTRSAKRKLQDQEPEKGSNGQGKKPARSTDKNASNNTTTSTGGESGSDTSSVRTTRKSGGLQPLQDSKPPANSTPSLPPEPEVLGKRCSALNAAAKLLAMKGRVDTPGHTPRKDSGTKASGSSSTSSSDKNQKPKIKSTSPQNNSVNITNNKGTVSKPSTPNQSSRPASRSTRQCPGSLVPPLEMEYKRSKTEEKERGSRKSSGGKDGDTETRSSSRGHSACSSISSDNEGDGGGRSSRSRSSSSNSSQRTHSISSQNTEHRESHSRAASSGSERERDRSSERAKSRDKREKQGQERESRKDSKKPTKLPQEVTSSSGTEGTPDRVLRSVAALAAVQARSPAASTRSSSSQHRHNKT
ncbi:helicase SRCAP isoform X3 [Sphaeramia orbicularis]|uniref:helicase SRCAP isoform X3 n=1 Tax=Sphaeramia orbicularis TaxID=375764 RepID=UPI0011816E42|nr:helicase SRCAP isoform X3 [Sphaeramia orbicularis]